MDSVQWGERFIKSNTHYITLLYVFSSKYCLFLACSIATLEHGLGMEDNAQGGREEERREEARRAKCSGKGSRIEEKRGIRETPSHTVPARTW